MDAIDKKILKSLQKDGQITNLKLAEQVGLSPTPCLRRVKALEEAGVIEGYTATINPKAAGLGISALVLIKIGANTREAGDEFTAAIDKIDAVTECHTVAGRYDYICRMFARDMEEHERVVKDQLSRLPRLVSMETLFVLASPVRPRGVAIS